MKPVEFKEVNVIYAKDQPEYLQLPAYKDEYGNIITEWTFSPEERKRIAMGEDLRISIMTFNQPLQPLRPYLNSLVDTYEAEDKGKKENAFSDRKCGDPGEYDISKEE